MEQADSRAEVDSRVTGKLLVEVSKVMEVVRVSNGEPEEPSVARFEGQFRVDSDTAYDQLHPAFSEYGLLLKFREEGDTQVVLGIHNPIPQSGSRPWVNLALFLATLASVVFVGMDYAANYAGVTFSGGLLSYIERTILNGSLYAASLLSILLAHEFGHYLVARHHKTLVSLPYFLPLPVPLSFGTLGAVIRLKSPPRNKSQLLDIGLAGPIAGLVIAIPVLLIGLYLSEVSSIPVSTEQPGLLFFEGNSLFYLAAKYLIKGELLPQPLSYGGLPESLYWLRYLALGIPLPLGGRDVILHPMAWAGWAGLLVTALNLIPAGQLDGGHAIYGLLGRNASKLWPITVIILIAMGLIWTGWFLWAGLVFFFGRRHALPLDEITPLDQKRKALAIAGLILFILVFVPVPVQTFLIG
jgi:membrane-associated protease RseP (regulator of RpoE activity)